MWNLGGQEEDILFVSLCFLADYIHKELLWKCAIRFVYIWGCIKINFVNHLNVNQCWRAKRGLSFSSSVRHFVCLTITANCLERLSWFLHGCTYYYAKWCMVFQFSWLIKNTNGDRTDSLNVSYFLKPVCSLTVSRTEKHAILWVANIYVLQHCFWVFFRIFDGKLTHMRWAKTLD